MSTFFKKRFANYDKRFQFEQDDAQSSSRLCYFDNLSTKLSLSHNSLQHVSDLSRHRVARESNYCFLSNKSHNWFTSISRAFSSTTTKFITKCQHPRAARAIAKSLRLNSQKVQLYLSNRRSIDLCWILASQAKYRLLVQREKARIKDAIASRLQCDNFDARHACVDNRQQRRSLSCLAFFNLDQVCFRKTNAHRASLLQLAIVYQIR